MHTLIHTDRNTQQESLKEWEKKEYLVDEQGANARKKRCLRQDLDYMRKERQGGANIERFNHLFLLMLNSGLCIVSPRFASITDQ